MSSIRNFREKLNVKLFSIKAPVTLFFNVIAVAAFIGGFAVLADLLGFKHPDEEVLNLAEILMYLNYYFAFQYFVSFFLDFNPLRFARSHLLRSFLSLIIVADIIVKAVTGDSMFLLLSQHQATYFFIIHFAVFASFSALLLGKLSLSLGKLHLKPAALISLSFIVLIATGTILLSMPQMSTKGNISFIDALFTSTSASCVTGLIVQDTATFFTLKGQIVIMILMQIGGLNILIVASFIASLLSRSGSLSSTHIVSNLLDTDNATNLKRIISNVVYYSLVIELLGACFIFFSWGQEQQFASFADKMFYSAFHSVSAFNNAGFSLFSDGLLEPALRHQYGLHLIMAFQIIIGGLGFFVLQDIFSREKIRERKAYHWKKLSINSRMVLRTTFILLIGGALFFFLIEKNNALEGYSFYGKMVTSFFQSATLRTAGFNTVDISSLTMPVLIMFMMLMFIGASPGSTGGGIKTTTFVVALQAAWANLRGKEHVEFLKRNISWTAVNKTYAIIAFSVTALFMFTVALSITESGFSMEEIMFEAISAMGTVGLSMGITPELSEAGKVLIIVLMYIGRLGSLTLGIALSRKIKYKNYKYPDTHLIIG